MAGLVKQIVYKVLSPPEPFAKLPCQELADCLDEVCQEVLIVLHRTLLLTLQCIVLLGVIYSPL